MLMDRKVGERFQALLPFCIHRTHLPACLPTCLHSQDTMAEYFKGGSSFGLKDILTIKNDRRVINFYNT
jgi:hypothetical protein